MSEQEQEQPLEPFEDPETPQVDDDPDQDEGTETEAPPVEPVHELPDARDDRDIDAIYTKLETRAKNYVKSVGEILEDGGVPVHVCEMCLDGYPGLRWTEPRDEMHAALVNIVAESEQGAPLRDDPNAEVCGTCDGYGVVKLPSHVPQNNMRTCRDCNGAGYRELNPQSNTPITPVLPQENGEPVGMEGVPLDDPSVVDLRARGFMVFKPPSLESVEQ